MTQKPTTKEFLNAAEDGNIDIIQAGIEHGMANVSDELNFNALMHAALHNQIDVGNLLISAKDIDLDAKHILTNTALDIANNENNLEFQNLLISAGASEPDTVTNHKESYKLVFSTENPETAKKLGAIFQRMGLDYKLSQ